MNGEHFTEVRIETDGWMPSPQHCRVIRLLCSYTLGLEEFIDILREAGEGLEQPSFTQDWDEVDHDFNLGVSGFRVMGPEDKTEAMRQAEYKRESELRTLAALKAKYGESA